MVHEKQLKGLSLFEKYLSAWVVLSILTGVILGKVAPGVARYLDGFAIYVGDAPVVSIPISSKDLAQAPVLQRPSCA